MSRVIDYMLTYFSDSKQAGSYFLLFLVSLLAMWYINRKKNMWLIVYGIVIMVLAVMNPVTVWIIQRVFPASNSFPSITWLIPILFYVPYGITELMEYVKTSKTRNMIVVITFFVISISGSLCGFYNSRTVTDNAIVTDEEKSIVEFLNMNEPKLVLADDTMISAICHYGDRIPLMYGKDLWTVDMDAGIMDGYNEEAYSLYDAMRCTKENIAFITDTAGECNCDYIVIDKFENNSEVIGSYELALSTDNYLIYKLIEE